MMFREQVGAILLAIVMAVCFGLILLLSGNMSTSVNGGMEATEDTDP